MDFVQALDALKQGYSIKRKSWDDQSFIHLTKDKPQKVRFVLNGSWSKWKVKSQDLRANDWEIAS